MCGKRLFDYFNFVWCRGNKKENAKKTLKLKFDRNI